MKEVFTPDVVVEVSALILGGTMNTAPYGPFLTERYFQRKK